MELIGGILGGGRGGEWGERGRGKRTWDQIEGGAWVVVAAMVGGGWMCVFVFVFEWVED